MRTVRYIVGLLPVFFSACSTPLNVGNAPTPEMIIYHVKQGSETQLETILRETWRVCLKERRVHPDPHILVKVRESETNDCYIVVFNWTGCFAMEYASHAVEKLWADAFALCEERHGLPAVEYRNVTKMIAPRIPEVIE
jgi:hypothetical protein